MAAKALGPGPFLSFLIFRFVYFILYEYMSVYPCVYAPRACLLSVKVRRGFWIAQNWSSEPF